MTDIITSVFTQGDIEVVLKLVVALFLGMSLGIERAIAGKTAGMRTYGLVTMGSALLSITGVLIAGGFGSSLALVDSIRFAAQIITGIGFIGAGLIFVKGADISGVTTAAGIWVASGVGIAIGYGFYLLAITATILAIVTFTLLWYVENSVKEIARGDDQEDNEA